MKSQEWLVILALIVIAFLGLLYWMLFCYLGSITLVLFVFELVRRRGNQQQEGKEPEGQEER